jgi:hypothetical protein
MSRTKNRGRKLVAMPQRAHFKWILRAVISSAAVAAATMSFAGPAHAAAATTIHGSITFPVQEFDDPDVCASYGFTIHAVEHETLLFNARFDSDGQFAGVFAHHDISFEISANGKTIYESDHYNNLFAPDGTSVAVGNETHIIGEDGKIVLLDAGRIVFDADGNLTFLAGQHPQLLGATFCAALTP